MNKFLTTAVVSLALSVSSTFVSAADITDPTPIAEQSAGSVDALNFEFSVFGGSYQRNVLGSASNVMFMTSVATPIPFFENFGAQLDAAIGSYDSGFTSSAAALHLFWRDPNQGMIGIYGDWAYVNPEHAGRVGVEFAVYNGPWSLDVLAGMQFGQHVFSEFIDEVDLSYYFSDNTRGSIGHRLTSRGHVGNLSFEHLMNDEGLPGWSIFGEIEAGEDSYVAGWGGIKFAIGSTTSTLKDRDRKSNVMTRIPRNIASVTQCGDLDVPRPATSLRSEMTNLCASEEEINRLSSTGIVKN